MTRRLYPEVEQAFGWLGRFGEPRMSGTGASVFIALPEANAAGPILAELPPAGEDSPPGAYREWSMRGPAKRDRQTSEFAEKLVKSARWGVAKW